MVDVAEEVEAVVVLVAEVVEAVVDVEEVVVVAASVDVGVIEEAKVEVVSDRSFQLTSQPEKLQSSIKSVGLLFSFIF